MTSQTSSPDMLIFDAFEELSKRPGVMTSQKTSPDMLKFDAFKIELRTMLENVMEEAGALQATAEDPVVLDRSWILNKIENQMVQETYVLEPRAMQVALGLGHLQKLPRELRDLVYGYAISNGDMAIVRGSKQTHKEASPHLFEKGICRLSLGFLNSLMNHPLKRSPFKDIQNLHIRVCSRSFVNGIRNKDFHVMHMFDGTSIKRTRCFVAIECDLFDPFMGASKVVRALKDFTGFEQVVLELDLQWWGEPWPDTMDCFQTTRICGGINRAINHSKELLEPTLGKAHGSDEEDLRMIFYPRRK